MELIEMAQDDKPWIIFSVNRRAAVGSVSSSSSRRLGGRRSSGDSSSSSSSRGTHVLVVEMRIVVSPPCPNILPSPLLTSILKPQTHYHVSLSSTLPPFLLSLSFVCSLFLGALLFTLSLICRQRVDLNTCGWGESADFWEVVLWCL